MCPTRPVDFKTASGIQTAHGCHQPSPSARSLGKGQPVSLSDVTAHGENGKGIGWGIMYVGQKFTTRSASASFGPKISIFEYCGNATKLALNFHSQFLAVPDQLSVLVL